MKELKEPENFDINVFGQTARKIYDEKFKEKLEPGEKGKIAAIEVESSDMFLGNSVTEAAMEARKKYPDSVFYFIRVGYSYIAKRR